MQDESQLSLHWSSDTRKHSQLRICIYVYLYTSQYLKVSNNPLKTKIWCSCPKNSVGTQYIRKKLLNSNRLTWEKSQDMEPCENICVHCMGWERVIENTCLCTSILVILQLHDDIRDFPEMSEHTGVGGQQCCNHNENATYTYIYI